MLRLLEPSLTSTRLAYFAAFSFQMLAAAMLRLPPASRMKASSAASSYVVLVG